MKVFVYQTRAEMMENVNLEELFTLAIVSQSF